MKQIFLALLVIAAISLVSCATETKPAKFDKATQERFIGHVFLD